MMNLSKSLFHFLLKYKIAAADAGTDQTKTCQNEMLSMSSKYTNRMVEMHQMTQTERSASTISDDLIGRFAL